MKNIKIQNLAHISKRNIYKNTFLVIFAIAVIGIFYWVFIAASCKQNFRVYSEEGYCEFNVKTCEGIWGCKNYDNVKIPCQGEARLCGEKITCPCDKKKENLPNTAISSSTIKKQLIDIDKHVLDIYEDFKKRNVDSLSIMKELSSVLELTMPDIKIVTPEEQYLWWNDEEGYSILVPSMDSIRIIKDDGKWDDNFIKSEFVHIILEVSRQVFSARGFSLNEANSSTDDDPGRFYDYVMAYDNNKELCTIKVNPDYSTSGCAGSTLSMCNKIDISCVDDFARSQAEQIPFLKALDLQNKEKVATVISQDGPFYEIDVHARRTGLIAILKKEKNGFRILFEGQEAPYCELIEKEEIPDTVLKHIGNGSCYDNEGERMYPEKDEHYHVQED